MRKKKETKADFLRRWLLPEGFRYHHLRYKSPPEKGVYWYWLARYVRARDVKMYGRCISCSRAITFDTCQGGHFMPAVDCGRDLLFDLKNVNAECSQCNAWDDTHLLGYAEGLDLRYGEGAAAKLRQRRQDYLKRKEPLKDWSKKEYEVKIREVSSYTQAVDSAGAAKEPY